MSEPTLYTRRCVFCLVRDASTWGGHVRRGPSRIIAGWCDEHLVHAETGEPSPAGWFGHWVPRMGERNES